jgi:hypothetical protein
VKLKPKAVNKPLYYFIVHELDKPGSSATVSAKPTFQPSKLVNNAGAQGSGKFLYKALTETPQSLSTPNHLLEKEI